LSQPLYSALLLPTPPPATMDVHPVKEKDYSDNYSNNLTDVTFPSNPAKNGTDRATNVISFPAANRVKNGGLEESLLLPAKPPRSRENSVEFRSLKEEVMNTKRAFESTLHGAEHPRVEAGLKKFEEKTGQRRELLGYIALILLSIYLIFGNYAEVATNLIGFAYPALASLRALGSPSREDDRQWLIYWTVFGFFTFIDFFVKGYFMYFPVYYMLKAAFLVYLHMPNTQGALKIYDALLKRFFVHKSD